MQGITYFDNAATTFPKADEVYEYMGNFYKEHGFNIGRGQYGNSKWTIDLLSETRNLMQKLLNAPNKEVVFTATATEALNILIQGIPNMRNRTIYISPFEHNAVTRVLYQMKERYSITVEQLSVERNNLDYNLDEIKHQFLLKEPCAVIVSHVSNVCGAVAPVSEICIEAKKYGAVTIVDMCQSAGLVEVEGSNECFDALVFAGHKTIYGPFGISGFLLNTDYKPMPLIFGGTGIDSATQFTIEDVPQRYEVGSQNVLSISGLYAALNWIDNVTIDSLREKEEQNKNRIYSLLESYSNISVIKPFNATSVVSCVFDNYSSENIGDILKNRNIAVRSGLHCSPTAHSFLGTYPSGTVRFSPGYFTKNKDYEVLKEALDYILLNS